MNDFFRGLGASVELTTNTNARSQQEIPGGLESSGAAWADPMKGGGRAFGVTGGLIFPVKVRTGKLMAGPARYKQNNNKHSNMDTV